MLKTQRNIFVSILIMIPVLFLAFLFLFANASKAHAQPSAFTRKQSAPATSTVIYMTPGTATTTAIIDCQLGGSSSFGCDSGALMVQLTASSTLTILFINEEFSQGIAGVDCSATPTACDWYEADQTTTNGTATTTLITSTGYDIGAVPQFSFKFASSTIGGQGTLATNNVASRLVTFQSPTRYIRFVFSLKTGSANGGVYWDVVSKKQNN